MDVDPPFPTIPWFSDEVDRNRRYGEWVAEGNSMRDGLVCWVAPESLCTWRDGRWVTV
jgi:hypothetical protein